MTDIHISDQDIEKWKKRLDEVETQMMLLEGEKDAIRRKLEFVKLYDYQSLDQ